MKLRASWTLLTVALATHASAQQGSTREVVRRVDERFFSASSSQCQATPTDSLSHEQVTGLEELPADIRGELLEDLPLRMTGGSEHGPCLEAAAELLAARLHALCWMDASVTWTGEGEADSPASKPRFHVRLGPPYQVGNLFVATDLNPRTSPRLIIQAAKKAIPENRECTATMLEDIRERVYQLGAFQEVKVNRGAPASRQPLVFPIIIDVREKAPATP